MHDDLKIPDLEEIAVGKGIFRTTETRDIIVDPQEIRVTSTLPPLFGDQIKQRIGADLVQLAKQHGEWIAVLTSRLFGENSITDFSNAIRDMYSKGYIVLYGDKRGLMISPTQELADFYIQVRSEL